eukprot:CAMPEP_0177675616 /NCGR_PEP_ID=MMETSP0447-20121125/27303_1 /TAXON_ID=0 /ORGANISM="Stygamoeba regulata, Strain BSH-02190019" /LENGTH=504 /DNA_ID=CAMNT_0019184029 /DNA_START=928 /DNA_END=2438 /DNA_ORIENTATION=-
MYLELRDPVPINVNPAFVLKADPKRTDQASRAAGIVRSTLEFLKNLKEERLVPDMEANTPLCMRQYRYLFGASRIPKLGRDAYVVYPNSRHVVVISRNQFYTVDVLDENNTPYQENQIRAAFHLISRRAPSSLASYSHPPCGVLTTTDRDVWAAERAALESFDPINRDFLHAIDSAIMVVCLDESSPGQDTAACARDILHGHGLNRWFDKAIQLIVAADGCAGFNMEHSAFDGHTLMRYIHDIQTDLDTTKRLELEQKAATAPYQPLDWVEAFNTSNTIHSASRAFQKKFKSLDIGVAKSDVGKKDIVACQISPDAAVQLAIQLAYFRVTGSLKSTYEAAMTKKFLHGRTETVRTMTTEVVDFVSAMESPVLPLKKRQDTIRQAAKRHVEQVVACKNGQGIDRHLWVLKNLANFKQKRILDYRMEPFFEDPVYQRAFHFNVSTSNCGSSALSLFSFGPVVQDGVGLGYMIKDDSVNLTASSYQHKQGRDFVVAFNQALNDMINT